MQKRVTPLYGLFARNYGKLFHGVIGRLVYGHDAIRRAPTDDRWDSAASRHRASEAGGSLRRNPNLQSERRTDRRRRSRAHIKLGCERLSVTGNSGGWEVLRNRCNSDDQKREK